jgi:hypothetical protein
MEGTCKGNIYVGENFDGRRFQRFVYKGIGAPAGNTVALRNRSAAYFLPDTDYGDLGGEGGRTRGARLSL